jgi:hypothetical protein
MSAENSGNGYHIDGAAGWYATRAEAESEIRYLLLSNRWSGVYPRIIPAGPIAQHTTRKAKG